MMEKVIKSFQLSALCVAMLCANSTIYALEELTEQEAPSTAQNLQSLEDDELAASTGEGIAMLPENAYMVFRGAGANETANAILTDRTKDTGYINYIPVGPLTTEAQNSGAGKADVYLYGLAISKADGNLNNRIAATDAAAKIVSWGTATNPWLLKVNTDTTVPNFSPSGACGAAGTTTSCTVTALILEAPLHNIYANTYTGVAATMPTLSADGADAYKLKLGMWADAFVRDPRKANGAADQFHLGAAGVTASDANRANRLRLQAVWDGLSLNGSNIKIFQTLGGASGSNTNGNTKDTSYNNTFGMSGLLRFNSGDTRNLRATLGAAGSTTNATTYGVANGNGVSAGTAADAGWTLIHGGAATTLNASTTATGCNNTGTGAFTSTDGCKYYVEARTRQDSKTTTKAWTAPTSTAGVLRFSTRETTDTPLLTSPAINNSVAPVFDSTEGLYLYGANINLVLGNLYQPLMFNKDGSTNNFSMELARIPNKQEIYSKVYTRYAGDTGDAGVTYLGSTCSVYSCGTAIALNETPTGTKIYQGNNATHSSISIGTTNYDVATGLMTADSSDTAVGVSFGALQTQTFSNTTYSAVMKDVRYKERTLSTQSWCGYWGGASTSCRDTRYGYSWAYQNSAIGTTTVIPATAAAIGSNCTGGAFDWSACTSSINTNTYSDANNRNWATSGAAWRQLSNVGVNSLIGASNGVTGALPTANQAPTPAIPTSPSNNFGSAAIDGLLIQHLKITTKGL